MSPERAVSHLTLDTLWDHHADKAELSTDAMHHLSRCTDCLWVLGVCQISSTLDDARRYYNDLSGGKPMRGDNR
jgi:hypothetical protein